jgi:O-antigen ligase
MIRIFVRRENGDLIVQAFILSGFFAATVAIYDFITGSDLGQILSGPIGGEGWGRYYGPLGHPNKFGFFLVLSSSLTFIKWFGNYIRRKIIYILAWCVQITGIYLSGSVTALIGLIISHLLIVTYYGTARLKISKIIPLIIPFLIIGLITIRIGDDSIIVTIFQGVMEDIDRVSSITAGARMYIFNLAWDEIIKNPFIGVGFDQLSTSGLAKIYRLLPGTIHNVFLQILYAGGFLSLFGLIISYGILSLQALRTLVLSNRFKFITIGLAASVLALIVMDQFQDALYQREKWLVIGLFTGYYLESDGLHNDENNILG